MKKYILIAGIVCLLSCKKDFLDKPQDDKSFIPTELADFQALLDNTSYMNKGMPKLGQMSDDDYSTTDAVWGGMQNYVKNTHIWARDLYGSDATFYEVTEQWTIPYRMVFYANTALDGLKKITRNGQNAAEWDNVQGSALFYRSFAFFTLAQLFAPTYDQGTAGTDLGIPLRLSSGIEEQSVRVSVKENYDQILADLQEASKRLIAVPLFKTRPSKPAAFALLSRAYLVMQDFSNAQKYADSALFYNNSLLDYNPPIVASATNPIPRFNTEVLFHTTISGGSYSNASRITDVALYNSYHADDLRKTIFYRPSGLNFLFKGSYDGTSTYFCGLANDEVYLTRAECRARLGNLTGALTDLNALLIKRWKAGTFISFTAANADAALVLILQERRKELISRGMRWIDLRRLNKESRFAKNLTRTINGQTYTLPPNDPRYVFPIPQVVVELSGLPQNIR